MVLEGFRSWQEEQAEANEKTLRSIRRQFDDTPGGGFADETAAVLDPTRSGSATVEEDVRQNLQGPQFAALDLGTTASDTLDEKGGVTPPQDRQPTPNTTPSGDGNWFSGADPTDPSDSDLYPSWLPALTDNLDLVIGAVVVVYVLSVLGPVLELGANIAE